MPARSHGKYLSPEYNSWKGMIRRCTGNHKNYANYGGRGIEVCERWRKFANFYADMGDRPSPDHTLDRYPNQNGNYEPGNCRWATRKQQSRNMRRNKVVTAFGKTVPLVEFFGECSSKEYQRAAYRIRAGWDAERAISALAFGWRSG